MKQYKVLLCMDPLTAYDVKADDAQVEDGLLKLYCEARIGRPQPVAIFASGQWIAVVDMGEAD